MADKQDKNIVKTHGRDYMTVAGRLQLAHDAMKQISITTEVVPVPDAVVVRATVTTPKGTFTGISAANPSKLIEKQSPYEVAETSAVGRALGFAGFGAIDTIASADEMAKEPSGGMVTRNQPFEANTSRQLNYSQPNLDAICTCGTAGKYHAKDCPARAV